MARRTYLNAAALAALAPAETDALAEHERADRGSHLPVGCAGFRRRHGVCAARVSLRVPEEDEREGLDITSHGERRTS
jgi:hypothetical protein